MSVSLTNSRDITATALYLIQSDGTIVDIQDIIDQLEGALTPDQLQTLSALSSAINNDPTFF